MAKIVKKNIVQPYDTKIIIFYLCSTGSTNAILRNMQDFIIPIISLLAGGGFGWLFTMNASKRKANGEATQTEADAMKSVQDVYQQTIDDLNKYVADLRADRNSLRADRDDMRKRNKELEEKVTSLQDEIQELKKEVARFGRKVDAMRPFLCARIGCGKRTAVSLHDEEGKEEESC